jgi:WD40 repeat protein
VQSLALSPDGKTAAAGLVDNSIHLLDVAMGKDVKTLAGHTGPVTALAYTPKGDLLVSASADKTAQVWNVADGANKGKLDHGAAVHCLAVSADGARLATGGADKTVKVWTLADSKTVATVNVPAEVHGVAFSPDGTRLVVGTDTRARVYGLDGKQVEFFPLDGPVAAVAYHPNGKMIVAAGADKTARAWTSALVWQAAQAGPVRQAVFSPKGDLVLAGGDDGKVRVWNAADGKPVREIAAHTGAVAGVVLTADGLKLISAGADKTAKVWSLAPVPPGTKPEDKPVAVFPLAAPARSLALSPNGARLAVGVAAEKDNRVQVFDLASGKELLALTDHAGPVTGLAFAPDNRALVSASADKTARAADVGGAAVWEAHPGGVTGAAFNANGTQAVSGGADKTVKLWDVTTAKPVRTFGPLADPVSAVAFSRDFTQVGAAAGKVVKVWNAADGKELLTLTHPANVTSLSFSVDKLKIVTGAADNLARVWDVGTGKEMEAFVHAGPVQAVVFHPNNTSVVTGSADKTAVVQTLSAVRVVPASAAPLRALALTPNASHVLTASDDKTVKMWNLGNGAMERAFPSEGAVAAVAVAKNNALVALGGADKSVRVFTLADAKPVGTLPTAAAVQGLAFSPNSLSLAAACADGSVPTWSVPFNPGQPVSPDFGKPSQGFAHAAAATDLAFAADNVTLYTAGQDKTAKVWKFASDAPTKNLGHPQMVDAVAWSPDGKQLATGCHDGIVRVWDVAKGAVLKQTAAHMSQPPNPAPQAVYSVAWSPDGKQVVSASLDQSMKLWDAAAGTLVREFKPYKVKDFEKGHREGVFSVAFSPDGKTLASGSSDRTIKLWNVADGNVLRECVNPNLKPGPDGPVAHPGWVYSVRFTADGKYLLSAGPAPQNRGFLAVWQAADGKMVYGEDLPLGPFHSVALAPDGKTVALACGPQGRQAQEVTSYVLKMPDVVK